MFVGHQGTQRGGVNEYADSKCLFGFTVCSGAACPPSTRSPVTDACTQLNTRRPVKAFGRNTYKANTIRCQRTI